MPYIKQDRRKTVLLGADAENSGDLNFLITEICQEYLNKYGKAYTTINDIVGALEGAKLEFYRRIAAPYEDTKIVENGDVYGPEEAK